MLLTIRMCWRPCIGQILAAKKCEVLAKAGVSPVVRLWSHEDLAEFARIRKPPEATLAAGPSMPSSPSLLVLGAHISMDPSQQAGLDHRVHAAWKASHQVLAQLKQRTVPIRLRAKLLQACVWPGCMWCLESVNLTKVARCHLSTLQRKFVQGMLFVPKRPEEDTVTYSRRRERITTANIGRHFPCKWGDL